MGHFLSALRAGKGLAVGERPRRSQAASSSCSEQPPGPVPPPAFTWRAPSYWASPSETLTLQSCFSSVLIHVSLVITACFLPVHCQAQAPPFRHAWSTGGRWSLLDE